MGVTLEQLLHWNLDTSGSAALFADTIRSLAESLRAAIHVRVEGDNAHHMIESCFKGLARCLRQAIAREGTELPSTKGLL